MRRSLLLRIYGFGLLLLGCVAASALLITSQLVHPQLVGSVADLGSWALEQVFHAPDAEEQRRQLEQARRLRMSMTLYSPSGEELARVGTAAPPPDTSERRRLQPGQTLQRPDGGLVRGYFPDGELRLVGVLAPIHPPVSLAPAALMLAGSLLVLALLSIPMARSLTRPLDRLGVVARRLGAGDLTARAPPMADQELAALALSFNEMALALETLRRSEKELLANVSHELRTPLARIRVVLELIADGDPSQAHAYVGELSQDLGELEQLTEDIIATARLELTGPSAALLPLRLEQVDLGALCERSVARLRASRPGAVVTRRGDGVVEGDPVLLRRALDNLLDNAWKYSPEGSPIEVTLQLAPDAVRLTVTDRGCGLAPADLARVFTPFFRADPSRTRATGGVGLGLLLTRRIVEAHGGHIDFTSQPGQGSVVTLRLPRTQADTSR